MVSFQGAYTQNLYPAVRGGVNNLVQSGEVAQALQYARGESENTSHSPTMKETLFGLPIGLGIMGVLGSGIWTISKLMEHGFSGMGTAFSKQWEKIGTTFVGADFTRHYATRVGHNAQNILSGLNEAKIATIADPKMRKKAGEWLARSKKLVDTALAKGAKPNIASKKLFLAEEMALRVKSLIPAATPTSMLGKAWHTMTTPFRAVTNSSAMKAFSETGIGKMFNRGGGVFFAIMEGGIETFTEIIPAFYNGGIISGVKQIGKSIAKSTASMAGFLTGEAIGAPLGAMVGSIFGPVGAWLGGFIGGMAGGMLLSAPAIGIAKMITGKSEGEKRKETQLQSDASQIMNNPEQQKQLAEAVLMKAQEDIQSGHNSPRTQEVLEIANKLKGSTNNPFSNN